MIVGRGSKVEISTCHRQRVRPSVYLQPGTLLFRRCDWRLSHSAADLEHRDRQEIGGHGMRPTGTAIESSARFNICSSVNHGWDFEQAAGRRSSLCSPASPAPSWSAAGRCSWLSRRPVKTLLRRFAVNLHAIPLAAAVLAPVPGKSSPAVALVASFAIFLAHWPPIPKHPPCRPRASPMRFGGGGLPNQRPDLKTHQRAFLLPLMLPQA